MKKLAIFATIILLCSGFLFAQDAATGTATTAAQSESTYFRAQTEIYSVMSEVDQANADTVAATMDAFFQVYNSYFHFSEAALKARLNIRIFKSKENFDAYLNRVLGQTRDDFVYLHYPTQEKCELVLFNKTGDDFDLSLAHQGFVQYIKAFISSPPIWLREGFAVYFENLKFNAQSGMAIYKENLSWLETVKSYKQDSNLIATVDFLKLTQDQARENMDVFYPEAWMYVSFLVNTEDKAYNRLMWDTIAAISKEGTLEENTQSAWKLAETWVGFDQLDTRFLSYIDSRKTFAELINDGMSLYAEKKYDAALSTFTEANKMNDAHHVPYYYLGLINYYKKDYAQAEIFYKTAIEKGCDAGIANYALGINAYTDNRFAEARTYLLAAKEVSPDKYGTKSDELLAKIQ